MPKKFKFGFDMKNVDWVKVSTCVLALLAVVLAIMILVKVDKSKQGFSLRSKNGNGKLGDDCAPPGSIFPGGNCCPGNVYFDGGTGAGPFCLGNNPANCDTSGNAESCADAWCDYACESNNGFGSSEDCQSACASACSQAAPTNDGSSCPGS